MAKFDHIFFANFEELSLHESGREQCGIDKYVDITVKNYHLFHYVLNGEGTLLLDGKKYHLKKGHIFYIPPNTKAVYYPNKKNPWMYAWVGFNGSRAEAYLKRIGINIKNPIFNDQKSYKLSSLFISLVDSFYHTKYLNIDALATFMKIIYQMTIMHDDKDQVITIKESYIRSAKQYIENNYQYKIKVSDIADALGLTPNYLANVFKEELDATPKQYLTHYRMLIASELLVKTNLNIKEIANEVGYKNPFHFSNEFKKVYNTSPTDYRIKNLY